MKITTGLIGSVVRSSLTRRPQAERAAPAVQVNSHVGVVQTLTANTHRGARLRRSHIPGIG